MPISRKTKILLDALTDIAFTDSSASLSAIAMCQRAAKALSAYNSAKEYRITARTWWSVGGGEYKAELRNVTSGNIVFEIHGVGGTSSAWEYDMRDAMHERMPEVFPAHERNSPTIYFRDVCGVDYEHREVSRKRSL